MYRQELLMMIREIHHVDYLEEEYQCYSQPDYLHECEICEQTKKHLSDLHQEFQKLTAKYNGLVEGVKEVYRVAGCADEEWKLECEKLQQQLSQYELQRNEEDKELQQLTSEYQQQVHKLQTIISGQQVQISILNQQLEQKNKQILTLNEQQYKHEIKNEGQKAQLLQISTYHAEQTLHLKQQLQQLQSELSLLQQAPLIACSVTSQTQTQPQFQENLEMFYEPPQIRSFIHTHSFVQESERQLESVYHYGEPKLLKEVLSISEQEQSRIFHFSQSKPKLHRKSYSNVQQLKENYENKTQSKQTKEQNPYYIFFVLTIQCIKLNAKDFDKVANIRLDGEWDKILEKAVPMNQWSEYLRKKIYQQAGLQ